MTSSSTTVVLRNTTVVMFRNYFGLPSKLQLFLKAYFLRKFPSYDVHVFSPVYLVLYRVTHGNLTSFEWVVFRTAQKKNKLCQYVVSTRWCHSAHYKRVNDHCSKHVSRAPHFPFRRRAVASSLSRSFNV